MTMSNFYRRYSDDHDEPNVIFNRSKAILDDVKAILSHTEDDSEQLNTYGRFTADSMAHVVYGSNHIERAGMGLDETLSICRDIFDGLDVDAANVDERTPTYEALLAELRSRNIRNPGKTDIIRSRREVIQHAQAMKYILDAALNRDEPLSEELILETHRRLCDGIPASGTTIDDGIEYAGRYREVDVCAGYTQFASYEKVPDLMKKFVNAFNDDIKEAELKGTIDPFFLAADACQDFVTIHPFRDGNGRMCRLILNAFLMKYAGIMVSIGERDDERAEYLRIAEEAGDGETEEEARGKLATLVLGKAEKVLGKLKAAFKH